MTNRRAEIALAPSVAFERVCAVLGQLGSLEESNATTRSAVGKARYGMNPVRVRVSILSGPTDDTAVAEIQARGQDLWGVASRKVIDRLLGAI